MASSMFNLIKNLTAPQKVILFSGLAASISLVIFSAVQSQPHIVAAPESASTALAEGEATFGKTQDLDGKTQDITQDADGKVGFEIFDQQSPFTSNGYNQKINYQRAVQGELVRAIQSLSPIKKARVILTFPQQKSMLDDTVQISSASVVLQLKQNRSLKVEQINAIRLLVASAQDGLKPEQVTIIDEQGRVLSNLKEADVKNENTKTLEQVKNSIEKDLQTKLSAVVEKVVGAENVVLDLEATVNPGNFKEEELDSSAKIERLNVSLTINNQILGLDLVKLESLAKEAINFNSDRGDVFKLDTMDFHRTKDRNPASSFSSKIEEIDPNKKIFYMLAALTFIFLFLAQPLWKWYRYKKLAVVSSNPNEENDFNLNLSQLVSKNEAKTLELIHQLLEKK